MTDIIPCKWDSATRSYYPVLGATCTTHQSTTEREEALEAQVAELTRELAQARALCERLKQEAQFWSGEARAHKSSLHEAYQVVTGSRGEPGNWNGAKPIREAFAALANCPAPADAQVERRHGIYEMPDGSRWHSGTGEITRAAPADAQGVEPDEGPTEWFWRIVDANGLGNVSSDEETALRELVAKAERYDQMLTAPPPDQARREALVEIAARIERQHKGSLAYLLEERPREHPNMPSLAEITLSHFLDIARDLRALASPAPAAAQAEAPYDKNRKHPSHVTRSSDASTFDEVCVNCGAKDIAGGGWGNLAKPCPAPAAAQKGDEP